MASYTYLTKSKLIKLYLTHSTLRLEDVHFYCDGWLQARGEMVCAYFITQRGKVFRIGDSAFIDINRVDTGINIVWGLAVSRLKTIFSHSLINLA